MGPFHQVDVVQKPFFDQVAVNAVSRRDRKPGFSTVEIEAEQTK